MSKKSATAWIQSVRQYIYQMLLVVALFSIAVFILDNWTRTLSDEGYERANDYHLASSLHFLAAGDELHRIELIYDRLFSLSSEGNGKIIASPGMINERDKIRSIWFVAKKRIQSAVIMQNSYEDKNFTYLMDKLSRKTEALDGAFNEWDIDPLAQGELEAAVEGVLITLDQLGRLHTISHDRQVAELEVLERKQGHALLLMLFSLLLFCTFITVRGLKGIEVVMANQQASEEKIKYQAYFDSLTKLPNRFLILDRLGQLIAEAKRNKSLVALLFIDLDDFKKVNDTLGHDMGDKLLIAIAKRLSSHVRAGDTIGRLGGDEFVILLGGLSDAIGAKSVAEAILPSVNTSYLISGRDIILSASIGISVYPEDGTNAEDLLRNADIAMYHSKSSGRNTYSYFTGNMNLKVARRLLIEGHLGSALKKGEFEVVYQPQIDAAGNAVGAEALLRWKSAELGFVSPDEFIAVAEQTGDIVALGQFVLKESLAFTATLQKLYSPTFRIAINLSPCQFRDPDLVSFIKDIARQAKVPLDTIELEITEGVLISSQNNIDELMSELAGLNVKMAMDDFGTGYSSLSYLRQYSFHVLKIDRCFVGDIDTVEQGRELVNAVIVMSHALGLEVVAEGVETQAQLTFLKSAGCDYLQGYLIGKPMTQNGLKEWMNEPLNFKVG